MHSLTCLTLSSPSSISSLKPNHNYNPLLGAASKPCLLTLKRKTSFTTRALLSSTKESVLKDFRERTALKVLSKPCKTHFYLIFHLFSFAINVVMCMLINIWLLLKIITGLQNFDKDNVASVVTAAEKVLHFTHSTLLLFILSSDD